jgi:hypothetical protein
MQSSHNLSLLITLIATTNISRVQEVVHITATIQVIHVKRTSSVTLSKQLHTSHHAKHPKIMVPVVYLHGQIVNLKLC